MEEKETFYITTPIYYPNDKLHMGHAYTTTLSDIIARYHRIKGKNVYFLTGADENTEKLVRAAALKGKETQEYLDQIVESFKELFKKLNISYDQFIRTSDEKAHWPGAEKLWKLIAGKGDFEKRKYKGLYCVGHESFITEKDLVDGKCPDHNEVPNFFEEENYFFKLSKYTEAIKEKIAVGELKIVPESRCNEILALLRRGLEDISFSRPADKVSVGIPVPNDPTQKMYVWGDALSNYISALGFGGSDESGFNKYWPADVQVMAKDILRFHAAIWPAMLLSAGLPLPKILLVHGFIISGGRKMSKSLGNVLDPFSLINEYGTDAVRYYLARHVSPVEDSDLTLERFRELYTANLVNGLGNLVSRVMKMATTYDVRLKPKEEQMGFNPWGGSSHFNDFRIDEFCNNIWAIISDLDEYVQKNEPFKKIKTDPDVAKKDVHYLLHHLFGIAVSLAPIMPETSEKIKSAILNHQMPEPLFPRK